MRLRILKNVEEMNLLPTNEYIVVAVSGGPDSMSLIDFINFVKNKKKLTPIVAHVNHLLRGKESERDENFVRNYCKKNDIEFKFKKANTKKISKIKKSSIEETAREIRYNFFLNLSKEYGDAKIVTAHTLSDNTETFLINLMRGTGAKGLRGIPVKREKILRPFLFLKREEILKYCKTYNVDFINDSSNFSCDYTRNKIRLNVFSELKKINPSFENSIQNAIDRIKEDDDYLSEISQKEFKKSKTKDGFLIKDLPKPIISRVIILVIKHIFDINLNLPQINQILNILKKGNGICTLSNKNKVLIENNTLKKFKENETKNWQTVPKIKDFLTPNNKHIIIKTLDYDGIEDSNFLLDANKISGSVFRNRRAKDTFSKRKRGVTKSLKKFFNEEKVPASKRQEIVLLARGSEILWMEGFGASENAALNKNSQKVLEIIVEGK